MGRVYLVGMPFASALPWIDQYGYWALAALVFLESVGLPLPGETALLAASFAAARGSLSLPIVMLTAAGAGVLGDNLGYYLGRRYGRGWIERRGHWLLLSPARLERIDVFFARFGPAAVAIARFVAGVRVIAAFAAGVSRMHWRTFLAYNVVGAILWAGLVGAAGFLAGRGYDQLSARAGHAGVVALLGLGAVALLAWGARRLSRARRNGRDALARAWGEAAWDTSRDWLLSFGRHVAAAVLLGIAATLVFVKVVEDAAARESTKFDAGIRDWARSIHGATADRLFSGFDWIGSTELLSLLSGLAAVALWRARGRQASAVVLLAPLLAVGVVAVVRQAFHGLGPEGGLAAVTDSFSFPSARSTAATAVLLTLGYVLVRERLAPAWTLPVAGVLALLAGISRVLLDLDWATDVIGGWSVGVGIAACCVVLYERVRDAEAQEQRQASAETS